MALGEEVRDFLRNLTLFDMSLNQFIIRIIFAIILIVVGIIVAKLVKKGIKKILEQVKVKEKAGGSFFNLLIWVIQASIWILFINLALTQLNIPQLTNWLTNILIIIPAFVGALILIGAGFAVAVYLRSVVEDSDVIGWRVLSMIMFYFVLLVTLIYALKSALISIDNQVSNIIIIILTAIIGAGVAYYHIKDSRNNNNGYYKEIKARK